jgi:hypothetical protein
MVAQVRGKLPPQIVQIFSVASAAPDSKHTVRLSQIRRDVNGFVTHLEGLLVTLTPNVTKTAAAMTDVCPGERLYDVIRNVDFGIGGGAHLFLRNLRGLDLLHDSTRILGTEYESSYQDLADADAAAADHVRKLFIPFAHRGRLSGAEDDGIIPAALLGDEDFSFSIGSAGCIAAGVALNSCSVKIEAVLKYHHKLLVPSAWQVRSESTVDQPIQRAGDGYWQYFDIIDHDTALTRVITSVYPDKLKLSVDASEGTDRQASDYVEDDILATKRANPALDVPSTSAFTAIPIIPNRRDLITRQPKGPVKIEFMTRTTAKTTWIARTNGFHTGAYTAAVLSRLGVTEEALKADAQCVLAVQSARGGAPKHLRSSLPYALTYGRMPWAVPREGAAFKEAT